jgi:hypothetical protein
MRKEVQFYNYYVTSHSRFGYNPISSAVNIDSVADSARIRASCSAPSRPKALLPLSSSMLLPSGRELLLAVIMPPRTWIEEARAVTVGSTAQTAPPRSCPLLRRDSAIEILQCRVRKVTFSSILKYFYVSREK